MAKVKNKIHDFFSVDLIYFELLELLLLYTKYDAYEI